MMEKWRFLKVAEDCYFVSGGDNPLIQGILPYSLQVATQSIDYGWQPSFGSVDETPLEVMNEGSEQSISLRRTSPP